MVKLRHNFLEMPDIGLGTWQIRRAEAVQAALEAGYRHIDTAAYYGNEQMVGEVVRDFGRDEVFITTKLWNDMHGYQRAKQACQDSLDRLGIETVDLYLIHWPQEDGKRNETWLALEHLMMEDKVKAIGISNFNRRQVIDILNTSIVKPAINQIELHPWNYHRLKDFIYECRGYGLVIEAYSPLNQGQGWDHPTLQDIAEETGYTIPQVLICWSLQHEFVTIPRSSNPEHIRANFAATELELSEEHMDRLDRLGK